MYTELLSVRGRIRRTAASSGPSALWNFSEYSLWVDLFSKHLPKNGQMRALEVGSAPGYQLLRLHNLFSYIPFGIEYAEDGVARNRELFSQSGISADNVLHADFLDSSFHTQHRESFDVVTSFGFIEHFDRVSEVIDLHLNLLKPGGYLAIVIPNLAGANRVMAHYFDPDILAIHNLSIMNRTVFLSLFEKTRLQTMFCDYVGALHLGLFVARKGTRRAWLLDAAKCFQLLVNPFLYVVSRVCRIESASLSPYLVYIGRKKYP